MLLSYSSSSKQLEFIPILQVVTFSVQFPFIHCLSFSENRAVKGMGGFKMQRCQEWAERLIEKTRSSSLVHKATSNPTGLLFGALTLCLALWLLYRTIRFLKKPELNRPATPDLEKPASRQFKPPPRKPGG
jgi:hypothetical protein